MQINKFFVNKKKRTLKVKRIVWKHDKKVEEGKKFSIQLAGFEQADYLVGDESYLAEDCKPESSIIRKVFEDYEVAYNAECYELLESYEQQNRR